MEKASLELQVSKMMTTEVESVERGEVRRQNREKHPHLGEKSERDASQGVGKKSKKIGGEWEE